MKQNGWGLPTDADPLGTASWTADLHGWCALRFGISRGTRAAARYLIRHRQRSGEPMSTCEGIRLIGESVLTLRLQSVVALGVPWAWLRYPLPAGAGFPESVDTSIWLIFPVVLSDSCRLGEA